MEIPGYDLISIRSSSRHMHKSCKGDDEKDHRGRGYRIDGDLQLIQIVVYPVKEPYPIRISVVLVYAAFDDVCDIQRVVFSLYDLGFSGHEVKERLFEEAQVALEMADEKCVVAVVTGANTEKEILQLIMSVIKLSGETPKTRALTKEDLKIYLPKAAMTPREAYFSKKVKIKADNCKGRVAAMQMSVYPPGIPFLMPGEIIDEKMIKIGRAHV